MTVRGLVLLEIVGTFALIFVGAGAIIATGGKDLVAIALAHGLAIGLMVAAVNLGTPAVGSGVGTLAALVAEITMTFFLMYCVFGVAVNLRGARAIAGLVIGLTITMDIFVGGGLTGAAMNPARWFGPAIVQGAFADWWIYWVGPIVGAVLAALLWNEVYLRGLPSPSAGASSVDIEQTQGAPTAARAH